jgi:hypothetical protein
MKGESAMQIQNNFIKKVDQTAGASTSRGSSTQREVGATLPTQLGQHVPAPEVQNLVTLVQQQPEVREDKVNEAAQRLSNGDYLTHEAAVQTADAILAAPD